MTCAIWSLGQIPASLTVHWLKEIAISLSCSLKSACQLANKLKITGVSFYRSLCSELLPTPHVELTLQHQTIAPCVHCFATGNGSGLSRRISMCVMQIWKQRGKWNLCIALNRGHSAGSGGRDLLEEALNVELVGKTLPWERSAVSLQAEVVSSRAAPQPPRNQQCHLLRFWMGMWGEQGQSLGGAPLAWPAQGLGLGQRVWYIFIFPVPFAGGRPFSFLIHF